MLMLQQVRVEIVMYYYYCTFISFVIIIVIVKIIFIHVNSHRNMNLRHGQLDIQVFERQ